MGKVSKSRVFAVVLTFGDALGAYFIFKKTSTLQHALGTKTSLEIDSYQTPWKSDQREALIELLFKAGLSVRYYDPEEKQWMERSAINGLIRVPGNREGSWGPPTSIGEFERDYLLST